MCWRRPLRQGAAELLSVDDAEGGHAFNCTRYVVVFVYATRRTAVDDYCLAAVLYVTTTVPIGAWWRLCHYTARSKLYAYGC